MSEELKPCPFCGDEPKVIVDGRHHSSGEMYYVVMVTCKQCYAEAGYENYTLGNDISECIERVNGDWNKRA